ncbi:MAG: DUF1232 domain-containing protein [Candidatus Cloacimonetes bacterium]|nr:DUF1232 domain-containing protein [Candidatus Cloacimonadota bacterium]
MKKKINENEFCDKESNIEKDSGCKNKITASERLIDTTIKTENLVKTSDDFTSEINKKKFLKFYDKLRKKVCKNTPDTNQIESLDIKDLLFLLPDFVILFSRILADNRVSRKQKLVLSCILGYIIMPLDLIPDFIPGLGHLDDLIIAIYGVHYLLTVVDRQIIVDNWPGKNNILDSINVLIYKIDTTIYSPILKKIKYILLKFGIDV